MQTNKIIIITAPSGAGKTSITKYLLNTIPQLGFSISAATRQPRGYEKNGKDYYFISQQEFLKKIEQKEFAEWEMVYEGKYYGTLRSELERIWKENKIPLLDIDVKGAIHVQTQFPNSSLSIFIQPPSVEELKKRLQIRGTESEASLQSRVNKATFELTFKDEFDKTIVNDDLDKACAEAAAIVDQFIKS
jgi:guanylate kinase